MNITLGKDSVSMLNPPNEGNVIDGAEAWTIGRNCAGMIVLRDVVNKQCHSEFAEGKYMLEFCEWINAKL